MNVPEMECRPLNALLAHAVDGFLNGALSGAPAYQQNFAIVIAINLRHLETGPQGLKLLPSLGIHFDMELGRPGRVPHFIVLQARHHWILATLDGSTRCQVMGDTVFSIQIVRFVVFNWTEVWGDIFAKTLKIGFPKSFNASGNGLVCEYDDWFYCILLRCALLPWRCRNSLRHWQGRPPPSEHLRALRNKRY